MSSHKMGSHGYEITIEFDSESTNYEHQKRERMYTRYHLWGTQTSKITKQKLTYIQIFQMDPVRLQSRVCNSILYKD